MAVWIQPCPKLPRSKVKTDLCGQDLSLVAETFGQRAPGHMCTLWRLKLLPFPALNTSVGWSFGWDLSVQYIDL